MQEALPVMQRPGADDEGAAPMETTTFMKPKFAISALPGTGELHVQVKANADQPVRVFTLQGSVVANTN
jgi:hypothetical protein